MATKKQVSVIGRVLVDTRLGNSIFYVGDLIEGPEGILSQHKDSIDTHEDAVRYAKETGSEIKQIEVD